jgi:hypothetical protein
LLEHDLCANAFRVCREGEPVSTFPDHALNFRPAVGTGLPVVFVSMKRHPV